MYPVGGSYLLTDGILAVQSSSGNGGVNAVEGIGRGNRPVVAEAHLHPGIQKRI